MEKKQIDKEEIAKSSKELFDELGTIIPNELIGDTSISTDARFLYVVLSKNADPEVVNAAKPCRNGFTNMRSLIVTTGWKQQRIDKAFLELRTAGWIK